MTITIFGNALSVVIKTVSLWQIFTFHVKNGMKGETINNNEVEIFIEEMEELGDIWTPEDVKKVYGNSTLKEALYDRKSALDLWIGGLGSIIQ